MRTTSTTLLTLLAASGALARTDLSGCVSSETVKYGGASLLWYVPGTGEICSFLDCGGGMAPPKTTVPGCAAYSGTASYSPDYLPGYGPDATPTSAAMASSSAAAATSAAASPSVTAAPSLSSAAVSSSAAAASSSKSADEDKSSSSSSSSSAMASSAAAASSTLAAITTPKGVMTPVTGTPTAAATPSSYTGAAGRIEAAAGVAVGGVVAALAWL